MQRARVAVIIPALNEEASIGKVLSALPSGLHDVIVVDNGSTDGTREVAVATGARAISEPRRGYGRACLAGLASVKDPDIVVFLDADYSDDPSELTQIVEPILAGRTDLAIGSRTRGKAQRGSLTMVQRWGNALACFLMWRLWGVRYTDLGPFRAIRASSLKKLDMSDLDYGWTVQMQVRAARQGLRIEEVPVSYRKRIGRSKISGTLRGVLGAGTKILYTIASELVRKPKPNCAERRRLILFSRYPTPGKTKTRLIPLLGEAGAAELQRQMTAHTIEQCRIAKELQEAELEIRFDGGNIDLMQQCFGEQAAYVPQGEGDLGERLKRAFAEAFNEGVESVVVIGSDSPELTPQILGNAWDALAQHDLVIGPAHDGGYYLIGMKRLQHSVFRDIPWGCSRVLEETLQNANSDGLSCRLLPPLSDVDRPEDLAVWVRIRSQSRPAHKSITVVIPTLNEGAHLPLTLEGLKHEADIEVIVVDGGSTDQTCALARGMGIQVLLAPPGRATQMNYGAAHAQGEILVFLHADTRLPPNFCREIRNALGTPRVVAGAFRLGIEGSGIGLRLAEFLINARSRIVGLPYGDQGFFIKRDLFQSVGGFRSFPVMEDFEFIQRIKRVGKVNILSCAAKTSGRRWRECGIIRYTLQNQLTVAGYLLGISPDRLARWRQRGRTSSVASESNTHNPPMPETSTPEGTQSTVSA